MRPLARAAAIGKMKNLPLICLFTLYAFRQVTSVVQKANSGFIYSTWSFTHLVMTSIQGFKFKNRQLLTNCRITWLAGFVWLHIGLIFIC